MSLPNSIVTTGTTVEDAIEKGLKQLGVGPSQVIVEVITEPSRGFFGLGTKLARVRLQRLSASQPRQPVEKSAHTPTKADAPATTEAVSPPVVEEDPAAPTDEPPPADVKTVPATTEKPSSPSVVKAEPVAPTNKPSPATRKEPPAVYYGDDDDFFDEDGSYGEDDTQPTDTSPSVEEPVLAKATDNTDDDDVVQMDETPATAQTAEPDPEDDYEYRLRGRRYGGQDYGRGPSSRGRVVQRSSEEDEEEDDTDLGTPLAPSTTHSHRDIGERILADLIEIMEIPGTVEVTRSASMRREGDYEVPWILNIQGDANQLEPLIGSKGETLSALQYLTRLMVSREVASRANIVVDVDSYRLKRTDQVASIANRMADQVVETKRHMKLEPMASHERRIVHMVLRRRGDVETKSVGQGETRRVVIYPKPDRKK